MEGPRNESMKEWGKDFKVQMKSKQTQMVSPRKGPQTQMSTAQVGNRNQSSGWQQEWWGPRPCCLVRTKQGLRATSSLRRTRKLRYVSDFLIFKYWPLVLFSTMCMDQTQHVYGLKPAQSHQPVTSVHRQKRHLSSRNIREHQPSAHDMLAGRKH